MAVYLSQPQFVKQILFERRDVENLYVPLLLMGLSSHSDNALCVLSQISRFMGSTWAHLGPVGPRWTPCWLHEPCYQEYSTPRELVHHHKRHFIIRSHQVWKAWDFWWSCPITMKSDRHLDFADEALAKLQTMGWYYQPSPKTFDETFFVILGRPP